MVKAKFGQGTKELVVSVPQCTVLDAFQDSDVWTYAALIDRTGLDASHLSRALHGLACANLPGATGTVLVKSPTGKSILDTDSFTFNENFKHKLFRIKIPTALEEERSRESEQVRKYYDTHA